MIGQLTMGQLQLAPFYRSCVSVPRPKPLGFAGMLKYDAGDKEYMVFLSLCVLHVGQAVWKHSNEGCRVVTLFRFPVEEVSSLKNSLAHRFYCRKDEMSNIAYLSSQTPRFYRTIDVPKKLRLHHLVRR